MNGVVIAAALALGALLFVGIVLSRQTSRRKREAVASLEAERAALASPSILDLVMAEVEDLGLREIAGSTDIAPDVLLRVWNDADESVKARDRSELRFEVTGDPDAPHLQPDDVVLVAGRDGSATAADRDEPSVESGEDHA